MATGFDSIGIFLRHVITELHKIRYGDANNPAGSQHPIAFLKEVPCLMIRDVFKAVFAKNV